MRNQVKVSELRRIAVMTAEDEECWYHFYARIARANGGRYVYRYMTDALKDDVRDYYLMQHATELRCSEFPGYMMPIATTHTGSTDDEIDLGGRHSQRAALEFKMRKGLLSVLRGLDSSTSTNVGRVLS